MRTVSPRPPRLHQRKALLLSLCLLTCLPSRGSSFSTSHPTRGTHSPIPTRRLTFPSPMDTCIWRRLSCFACPRLPSCWAWGPETGKAGGRWLLPSVTPGQSILPVGPQELLTPISFSCSDPRRSRGRRGEKRRPAGVGYSRVSRVSLELHSSPRGEWEQILFLHLY